MKRFKSGGMAFYMLEPGELYPDAIADKEYVGAYVVFPYEGKWLAQNHTRGKWVDITDQRFETENEAFNFAYEHYIAAQAEIVQSLRH